MTTREQPQKKTANEEVPNEHVASITKKVTYDLTKVYFGTVLHVAFVRREVVALQTWKSSGMYSIEITFRDGATLTTEYDERWKWEKIVSLIEDELTP